MSNFPAIKEECAVVPVSPQEQLNQAADMARLLKTVVNQAGLARKLGGRKEHLEFEAWQTIARWHHCTVSTEWTRPIKDGDKIIGWEARVNIIDADGKVIGSSEGMCMSDEQNWRGKPSYALRSMAQTRTAGKALRSLFAHVAVLAGYSPTPAEEMDGVNINEDKEPARQAQSMPSEPPAPPPPVSGEPPQGQATDKQIAAIRKMCMGKFKKPEIVAAFMQWFLQQGNRTEWDKSAASDCIKNFDETVALFEDSRL